MRSASYYLLAGLLICAGTAPAQTPSPPPPARVDPTRIVPYAQSFRVVQAANGAEREVAQVQDQVVVTDRDIVRIQSITDPVGVMTDSSAADRATLKPRWHSSTSNRRNMRLEFGPKQVSGRYQETRGQAQDIKEPVGDVIFDASMLDVLVAALPLAEGYRASLPVFIWEAGGEISADVAVTGSETLDGNDTWSVDVTLKEKTAKYNVTKSEPHVVRIVSSPVPGVEIRFVQ